ncbi:hypothetical protein [Fibrella forsythiae]|uniref:Uncharacterized protein n=1 Tax=Fibrella forsythiae TaxID=2817061 RepID=A0ABS3JAJ8_9BACT|nr:hypothetical protein [Fibrella forsythiae]MBO0947010.1 hypothetical protein [Fibrella forsythiae]
MAKKRATAAQKKAQSRMKSAVVKAKKIRKASPNVAWQTALKRAWKTV